LNGFLFTEVEAELRERQSQK